MLVNRHALQPPRLGPGYASMTLHVGHDLREMATPAKRARAAAGDRKFVAALARGLEMLRAFKPTVTRLTYTLTRLGYLIYVERLGKYQLAPAALALGYSALANMRIRQIARGYMQTLADWTDASVALGTRDRLDLIYVEHCRSRHGVMLRLGLGSRIPIATTAMGLALLAGLPETEREWLLGYLKRQEGKRWPQLRAGIERAIGDVAERGFTLSIGEWERDINAVGVPLVAPDGSGAFAFNCGAPSFQFTRERLESEIGPRLVNMVRNVETDLGGR
jgi:DNA-binding IclR family transcriptional regulator